MARVRKKAPTDPHRLQSSVEALEAAGLQHRARVRFRKAEGGRWLEGTIAGIEADGSVALHDARGRRRSIPPDAIEIRAVGPRGGKVWQPLDDVVAQQRQLTMFDL